MQPFDVLYLWIAAPIIFFAVMLYSEVRFGWTKRDKRNKGR